MCLHWREDSPVGDDGDGGRESCLPLKRVIRCCEDDSRDLYLCSFPILFEVHTFANWSGQARKGGRRKECNPTAVH